MSGGKLLSLSNKFESSIKCVKIWLDSDYLKECLKSLSISLKLISFMNDRSLYVTSPDFGEFSF